MFGKNKLTLLILFLPLVILQRAYAEPLRDSDFDGLSDDAEVNIYKTDPIKWDTDADGISDYVEITALTNPNDSSSLPDKSAAAAVPLIGEYDPIQWYISRISGIVAFVLFTFVVAFGLIQSSKSLLKIKIFSFAVAMEIHRIIAWMGLFMVALHVSMLFFDDYFKINLLEALIPFKVERDFKSAMGFDLKIAVAFGIIGLYCILILISTSELRRKIVSIKVWRLIHYTSFGGYVLFLVHGFTAGSDSQEPWMQAIYISSLTLVFSLLLGRIFRKQLFFPKIHSPAPQKEPVLQNNQVI